MFNIWMVSKLTNKSLEKPAYCQNMAIFTLPTPTSWETKRQQANKNCGLAFIPRWWGLPCVWQRQKMVETSPWYDTNLWLMGNQVNSHQLLQTVSRPTVHYINMDRIGEDRHVCFKSTRVWTSRRTLLSQEAFVMIRDMASNNFSSLFPI